MSHIVKRVAERFCNHRRGRQRINAVQETRSDFRTRLWWLQRAKHNVRVNIQPSVQFRIRVTLVENVQLKHGRSTTIRRGGGGRGAHIVSRHPSLSAGTNFNVYRFCYSIQRLTKKNFNTMQQHRKFPRQCVCVCGCVESSFNVG